MRQIILLLIILSSFLLAINDNHVQTLQYYSKKTTKTPDQTVITETLVWMTTQNVKLSFISPEKRDIILQGEIVKVVGYDDKGKSEANTYNIKEVPPVIRQLLVPAIFGPATFMGNLKPFEVVKKGTTNNITTYQAISKKKKNIDHIEYLYDEKNKYPLEYKMYGVKGGLLTHVQFGKYKTFNKKYVLPTEIKTIIAVKDGLVEETEVFFRIITDAPIESYSFN